MRHLHCLVAALLLSAGPVGATDIAVVGLFPNKAVVQINGGPVQTLAVGQKPTQGVALVSVERGSATFDIDGRRRTMKLGQHHSSSSSVSSSASVTVPADARGHFVVDGQINGGSVRFIVDTGATSVALSGADARRLNIDYRKGESTLINTANGVAPAWRVRFNTVRVGGISIDNVDGVVVETNAMPALLGMSFLNRMDMRREGQVLTLVKRF